jgi:hypothetical protein
MSGNIMHALKTFELQQSHEMVYTDPNVLIEAGFPAFFLRPLIDVFESSEGYKYFRDGKIVDEMIGISHLRLIYEIAAHVGVPPNTGRQSIGRGFAMQANIEAIRIALEEHEKNKNAKVGGAASSGKFSVTLILKKEERLENAKDELFTIVKGYSGKVWDQGDAIVFSFACETEPEAESLSRELAHFPTKYGSILSVGLENPFE